MEHQRKECEYEQCQGECIYCSTFVCSVCGGLGRALPTHCPGYKLSREVLNLIGYSQTDYRDGNWTILRKDSVILT